MNVDQTLPENKAPRIPWWKKIIQFFLVVVVLAGGAYTGRYLLINKPKPAKKQRTIPVPLVETRPVSIGNERIELSLMGTVVPSKEVDLRPQVSGNVIWVSPDFEPGGILKKGQEILRIDPLDYQLAVEEKTALLSRARADMRMEMGHQEVAKRELELLGGDELKAKSDFDLVLRKPQLAASQAALDQAAVALKKAELDLKRTKVLCPFNALVVERRVNLGARLNTQDVLGNLVATSEYWVEAKVPVDWLQWISFPSAKNKGSQAYVWSSESDFRHKGRVLRLQAQVEDQGRMAGVIVAVDDPLAKNKGSQPLLLNQYVRIRVLGMPVGNVIALERDLMRDNQTVWVLGQNSTLDIRPVELVWKDKERALISSGLENGEKIIVSNLSSPVHGMPLKLTSENVTGAANEK